MTIAWKSKTRITNVSTMLTQINLGQSPAKNVTLGAQATLSVPCIYDREKYSAASIE